MSQTGDVLIAYILLFVFAYIGGNLIEIFFDGLVFITCKKKKIPKSNNLLQQDDDSRQDKSRIDLLSQSQNVTQQISDDISATQPISSQRYHLQKQNSNCCQNCDYKKCKPIVPNFAVPPLVGMMVLPLIIYNVDPDLFKGFDDKADSLIRSGTFGLILFKAGLGLDLPSIKKSTFTILKLIFLPQFFQALQAALFALYLLDMPASLAFGFGYLLAGGSTSVVIPLAENLQEQGYGTNKFLPTIMIVSVTIDAMFALTVVDFLVSIEYESKNIFGKGSTAALGLGLFEFAGSIVIGVIIALIFSQLMKCWNREEIEQMNITNKKPKDGILGIDVFQFCVMFILTNLAIFMPSELWKMGNFGYLFTVTFNSCIRLFMSKNIKARKLKALKKIIGQIWRYGKYFLFGLIGTTINLNKVDKGTVGQILIIIGVGIVVKVCTAFIVLTCCGKINAKERLVLGFSWIAKATVQVALGQLVNEREDQLNIDQKSRFGEKFATMSVISILICAPLGGVLGGSLAKKWFTKDIE